MNQSTLSQIEESFGRLSMSEQLQLIERLIHHVHQSTLREKNDLDKQLTLMAADEEVQGELKRIEREFTHTACY